MKNRFTSSMSICLLVTAGFFGFITFDSDVVSASDIIYVGSGPDNDSATINGGIILANPGDTVFVYSGIYYEHVFVDRAISLVGEDQNTTIIDGLGSGDVLRVGVDWVNVTGFTITNSGSTFEDAGIELDNVKNCELFEITVTSNYYGIDLHLSNENSLTGNNVSGNQIGGIFLFSSNNNNITGNTLLLNTDYGIVVRYSDGNNVIDNIATSSNNAGISISDSIENKIYGNNLSLNTKGIHLAYSQLNIIKGNNASNNDNGISLYSSAYNIFTDNLLFHNSQCGIQIFSSWADHFTGNIMLEDGIFIEGTALEHWNTHNIDTSNIINGEPVYYWKNQTGGVVPSDAGEVILANCTNVMVKDLVLTNGTVGIELGFSWDNEIISNSIISNNRQGIFLYSSDGNNITNNNVLSNGWEGGIRLKDSNGNMITENNVSDNGWGIWLAGSDFNFIANNNVSVNYGIGIAIQSSARNEITGNNVSMNEWCGIYFDDSNTNTISGNNLTWNGWSGVSFWRSDLNTISGNNILNNDDGISLLESNANVITSNIISSNFNYGIDLIESSGNTIDNCTIDNNPIGVHFDRQSDGNLFVNCSILNSGIYDFHFDDASGGNSHATTLNTTFNKAKVYYGDMLSDLTVKWFMHVHVIYYNDTTVSNAEIGVNDIYGTDIFYGLADSNGWKIWIVVVEYTEQDMNGDHMGDRTYYTPHNDTATDGILWGYAYPFMNISKVVLIILGTPQPFLPPTNLTTKVVNSGNNVELEWDESPSLALDHYLIYRADSATEFDFTTPYNSSITWPDPKNTTWIDSDPGVTAVDDDFYYIVRAANFDESDVSLTSNTAGIWTRIFQAGTSAFSLPLEPFVKEDTEYYCQDMNASYIKWMNQTTHTWMCHKKGNLENNTYLEVGKGYEIRFEDQNRYSFCGMPGAMIQYDEAPFGFDSTPITGTADKLTAVVDPVSGNVELSWPQVNGIDGYFVYNSSKKDGFWGDPDEDYFLLDIKSVGNENCKHFGAATKGTEQYYMVVPDPSPPYERGSSSYSIGVWTGDYDTGYDTLGLPLKLNATYSIDWYCDAINSLWGMNYYNYPEQRWMWHKTIMPEGIYDTDVVMGEGYQVSTTSATKFSFVGI